MAVCAEALAVHGTGRVFLRELHVAATNAPVAINHQKKSVPMTKRIGLTLSRFSRGLQTLNLNDAVRIPMY